MSNETDRELLELAATAAGVQGHFVERFPEDGAPCYSYGIGNAGRITPLWNPRTDDGDSRRLEVALNICVTPGDYKCSANWWVRPAMIELETVTVLNGDDKAAAVRLAVLQAAAEIGRAMP